MGTVLLPDALASRIANPESNFPEGNLTQDLQGLGRSPASLDYSRIALPGVTAPDHARSRAESPYSSSVRAGGADR